MTRSLGQVLRDERDGTTHNPAQRPRWLATASVRHALRMGGTYWALAVAALVASFITEPVLARVFMGLWLALGAWFLLSAAVLYRRKREGQV